IGELPIPILAIGFQPLDLAPRIEPAHRSASEAPEQEQPNGHDENQQDAHICRCHHTRPCPRYFLRALRPPGLVRSLLVRLVLMKRNTKPSVGFFLLATQLS